MASPRVSLRSECALAACLYFALTLVMAYPLAFHPATRALPIKGILVINMLDYVESMVVRADKNITSLKDLKGKTVAAPFGSFNNSNATVGGAFE